MPQIDVNATDSPLKIEIITGVSKKEGHKEWTAVRFAIGTFSTLYFPKSKFELDYIKAILNGEQV